MSATPPQNLEAEKAVIGAALVSSAALDSVLVEARLAPEHFYFEKHTTLWRVILGLHDQGSPVDEITVLAELDKRKLVDEVGGKHYVAELTATVPAPGRAVHYAGLVVTDAEWRLRAEAGRTITEAVAGRDRDKLAKAEALLNRDLVHSSDDYDPDALADIGWELVNKGGAECFPWPFEALNRKTAGGFRRGELVLIGGHTSHGKSLFLDQLLETNHKHNHRVRLYMNEMALEERVARYIARHTGIPYRRIITGKLDAEQHTAVNKTLNRGIPYGITLTAGWSAEEIAHHIRRNQWDIAAVDILHLIEYEDERDLSRISATFARCARQADCALIATVHLNEKRVQSATRPRPTLGDIRGSGSLKNDADVVCFVYREQDSETGEPLPPGNIYFSKVRNGEVGGIGVRFNSQRLRFEAASRHLEAA